MDIFKGIGDFFGGLFGQKKKREDEQPQPQQQQSAVSFNSTPKLGDNFANNASNPAQPQQPKEFAKSSVDLNPVKPVQPVQPQPQVNRDQERQQLANKYRQEETDRYNQGSDHAANFLNDIFSGGKTAQMRENTINQNIQNRVNAEMLRKYGPDDQQVKQNIAQTSQDINNKATSVNDFTKNYNNTVQQTVASPVSAVKGAANSVVETMPKVSGAVTELGANTIKLFDEDNQFANNLIDRVRADREKNIVRKTLNSATGLTDQDNKMAYGLGSSGTRMAIDAAMTPVTGGVAPALVHGVEAHSDMMDSLDNIEARKKAEAVAKGETYTPSSFTSRYLASTANAGAQAAIEKLGIDNMTGKIGGKFAKNMVGRAVTGALGEAGEEAAQQYAENFTKKLFDNKQNIHEGVAESALMGGIMGGAGKMAFGGMDSVKNPYKSNDMADGQQYVGGRDSSGILGDSFNPRNAYSTVNKINENWAKNRTAQQVALAKALDKTNGVEKPVNFGQLRNDKLQAFNKIMTERNQDTVNNPYVLVYPNVISKLRDKRIIQGGSTPEQVSDMAFSAIHNTDSKILPSKYPHIATSAKFNGDNTIPNANLAIYNDAISLKSVYPRRTSQIIDDITKNPPLNKVDVMGNLDGGEESIVGSTQSASGSSPFSARQISDGSNIAQNGQNVNDTKTIYNSNIRKAPDLVSYDANGNDTELKSNAYDSNIAQNDQKVNDSTLNNAQNINSLYGITTKENTGTSNFRENSSTGSYSDVSSDSLAQNDRNINGSALNDSKLKEEPELSGFYTRSNSSSYDSNIAQKVNNFNREYEPEIQDLQNAYRKYGDDFEFNLTPEQQATYKHLLRESPRDSEGRYIDPATGEVTIDKIVEDSQGKYVKGEVNELFDVSNKKLPSATKKYLENLQDSQFNTAHGTVKNHPDMPGKYVYGERLNASDLKDKLKIAPQLDEILEATEWAKDSNGKIRNVLNQDGKHPEIDNWNYGKVRYEPANSNRQYEAVVNVGTNENGNHFYSLDKTKRLAVPHEGGLSTQQASSDSSIAQNDQKVNRMQPFDPTERTPLVNGDRDFGGSFGNGFDPRGENSAVNKAAFPKVQKEELVTPELEKYGIKPTKTEYNQALEYILMEERPELFERYEKARLGLEALEENIEFNKFTPTELERLYGKNYAEHLDRGMISQMVRKNSLNGLDQAAMRGDMGEIDMEDYIDQLNSYYETKREVKDLEQEIREAYADPELREEAKQALWFNKYEEIENAVANLRQNGVDIDFDGYVELKYGNKAKNAAVKAGEKLDNEDMAVENTKTDKNIVSEAPLVKETDQKTRKFAETVLDTDTPPKDFVKLMHAGDESLKYTPKKNSEMWNRATKSVQESPERVFNELENTRVANDETMAKGIALAKHYQAMGDDLKASELYVELAKKATEAGRTVQALNLMRRTTPEGVLMSTMREVESYNDKMKNKPNKQINITPEQRAEFLGRLREAYAMPEGNLKEIRARRIAIGEAIREVRDQIPSSKWDKFTTLWKAGLLTAPTTHIRNIAGNIINGGSEKTAQTIGSAFDWMISKGTGKRTLTLNGFGGMLKGAKEGSGYAKDIMRTGIDTTGEIDSKWRDQRTNYGNSLGGKLAQGYTDFVFNSLNASDKIFRGSAEKMSIANQAKAIAINEKLRGDERKARIRQLINNPTNAMLENAKHDADMATFQQDTGLGQFVAKGRQAGGITKKATDIIMPFTGVPSAVADQLVNYSPLGVAKGVKQVADLRKAVKNGLDDSTITALQRKASTQLGRGITGTMLLGAGLALANAGVLSGQPRDEDEKRQWAAEGKKANALKIGNTWIPIDTLSPQMILAAAGANAQSRIKNGQGALEAGLNTLGDGVKSWTEQGYMTGIKDAIDTATGDKDLNKYAIQQATSLIPNGIRKLAAAMDDKARQANYGDLGESIQNSIPLWRNGLPAKYDIYGREIKTNPWSTMLDPQKSSTENPTDLSQKINEFRKNNPELDSVIPKTAPNKITINGQTRELTSSERSEYQRLLGENISKYMMSGGFNDASFNTLSEGDKKDMLEKIQSDVKKSVEMALFNKTSKQTNDNAKKIAQNIVNGGNNALNPEWKTKEQSKDELYEKPELEYQRLQAEYDKKKKNGDFDGRKVQELQERMKVRKAEAGKDTPKSYRDMYSSGKQSFNMLLKEMDSEQERNEAMTKVLEYGDKLVAAGLEKKNKFRDKYGNVNFDDSSSGKGGKKGKSAKVSASSVGTADITSTLSKNLLKTRGSQAKALSGMPTISVRNSGLQAKAKRSAVRFKK